MGEHKLQSLLVRLYLAAKVVLDREDGQGMSEYAMTVALIAFGCIAGESAVATDVNQIFISLANVITTGIHPQG
jgi:Flp pilus assembly pilin Flp